MNAEVASDNSVQNLKINEQCAVDSSVCGDLQNGRPGDCNGVKLEGVVREVESENGKEDLDGAYVFINGFDSASEDSVDQNFVVPDPKEDAIGDKGELKVNGCGHRGYFEESVTADKAVQGQHLDNGDNKSLLQVPTKDYVGNNGELKVNGFNGVGDFGLQVTEEKAIDAQPHEGVSNGSCVDEVKSETEVMISLGKSYGLQFDIRGEEDSGGVEIVVEELIAPVEIPESKSGDIAAPALSDKKDQQYENAAEVSDHVGETPDTDPEEIAESRESSGVAAPALSDKNESLENSGEVSDQVCEVSKPEPEDIPEPYESSDAVAPALSDKDEPLENAGDVSDQVDEVPKTESEESESYESSDVAAPTLSERKETLENAGEAYDQVDEVPKTESAVEDSISGDAELQKECGHCMDDVEENLPIESISEPKVVDEQESEIERDVAKSDLVLEQELTDLSIPSSSDVPPANVSGDSDQNVQMVIESLESDESPAPHDIDHESTTLVEMQPTADTTSISHEAKADPVVDEPEGGSAADISELVQTPSKDEPTPASEAETGTSHGEVETASSHDEPDIAPSPDELESVSTIGEAECDPTLIKTESPVIGPETENPSAGEPLIGDVAIKSLDLGQILKEQNTSTESLPSVDNSNVHSCTVDKADSSVHVDVEDKSLTAAEVHDESAPIIDNSGLAAELEKGQMVSSDLDLERADKDESLVSNDISSSCNVSTGGESEICFGSISQKELAALPTSDRNTDDLSSEVHAPSSGQEHTKSVNNEKRFFNYLIKVPRYDDRDNLREQINAAQPEVDEKTRIRDAIKIEREKSRALRDELFKEVDAAIKEEDAARESLNSKREEVAHVQEMVKAAKSTDEIDSRIRSMEHTLHHVTIDLKEEKQIMREIKQLRQSREQLSSNLGKQSLEQREQNEGRLKILRKEEELLRDNVSRAELVTKTAKKNYYNEKTRFWELVDQFKTANAVRQDAYQLLRDLKDRLRKKEDRFFTYRKEQKLCFELMNNQQGAAVSDKCIQQVEDLIKLWVDDSEFRNDYIRCNARSTLRRLGTSDGRGLGPNEEPQNVPAYTPSDVTPPVKDSSSPPLPSPRGPPPSVQVEARSTTVAEPSSTKPVEQQKKPTASKANNAVTPFESPLVEPVSVREEVVEVAEEPKRTNEEEEMVRKAEELRKEEVAVKLKEQRRLEEKAKAEAALERKKRNAERALARAAAKAQKEAELKEKEREKRLKKKERKNGGSVVSEISNEVESSPSETSAETPKEIETSPTKERGGFESVTKRPPKASHFIKQQNRVKSIPPPLRNRGKRRMHPWMWGVVVFLALALFFIFFGRDLF